jgi:DNA repair exonuclease SbcCD ATPase subunit
MELKDIKLDKIYHISDVHIRNFKRHEEYSKVFNRLYKLLKKEVKANKNSMICLTGDIVHAKTDITPELIQEVQLFFSSLANIAPTLLIPGNHDANLNNDHRLDSLTPIVNALNHPNLIYLKKSQVIELGGIKFAHWSVFDKLEQYTKAQDIDGDYKIALYHGPIYGALLEGNYMLKEGGIQVSDFDGFDLVLLGDIHKRQFLNENKTIAYPGSLIQQNQGEDLRHGIMIWDLQAKTGEFVDIHNDTAFYTVEVVAGVYQDIPEEYPHNIYLRIKHKDTSQVRLKEIISEIKHNRKVIEVSMQKVNDFSSGSSNIQRRQYLDLRLTHHQNDLLRQFLKDQGELTKKEIDKVCLINEEFNKKISRPDIPRNTTWSIKRFEFSDMFSYGKNNVIDFESMTGIYGLFAPNASGKSTLLDSITYCLFDKCSKTTKSGLVMNNQSNNFKCKLKFELNEKLYTIERRGLRQKSGNIRVEVDFFYEDGGNKVSLNGKDRSDTNENIRQVIGNYEDFLLTALSAQSGNSGFIDMKQGDRKDLLAQFLDINIFENLYNVANEETRDTLAVLKEFQKNDYYAELAHSELEISAHKQKISEIKEKKKDKDKERSNISKKLMDLSSSIIPITVKRNITTIEKQKTETQKEILSINKKLEDKLTEIDKINLQIKDFTEIISKLDVSELKDIKNRYEQKQKEVHNCELELKEITLRLDSHNEKLDKLKELEYDENCKYCMNNIFVKDAINTKKILSEDKKALEIIKDKKNKLDQELKSLYALRIKYQELEQSHKNIEKSKILLKEYSLDCEKLTRDIEDKKSLIKTLDQEIETCKIESSNREKNEKTKLEIEQNNKLLKSIEKEILALEKELTDQTVNLKLTENTVQKCKDSIQRIGSLQDTIRLYQSYLKATHRDGIPHRLITNTIPEIEEEVNNILSQLVDFNVVMHCDDKNVNAYIAYGEENYWPLELTSGMEKFIASLAIRVALINVSALPRPNFIAIDEGFGALDRQNLNSMVMLFDYLKTQFKFSMIISHIESMRDVVDSIIDITKSGGKSKIVYQ